uniref:Uncharacterized protein n=1 Tax=Arundo donax TaxID=35708 RepID=A0A0A9CM68_ARUDO
MGTPPFGRAGGGIDVLGLLQPHHGAAVTQAAMSHVPSRGLGAASPMMSGAAASRAATATTMSSSPPSLQMKQFMAQDFGLLQDMLMPSFVHSNGGNIQP